MFHFLSRWFKKMPEPIIARVPIAGLQYYRATELSTLMHRGDELTLVHEAENPHDSHAVMVLWHRNKIGYVPSDHAAQLSAMLSNHQQIFGKIVEIAPRKVTAAGYG